MDQFLQHGAQPAPLGRMADRAQLAGHAELSHQPQDVVGQLGEMQDQVVGGELAGRQALQVEIGLDLAVELLVGGMRLVALYHRLRRLFQAGPPAFQLIVRFDQELAIGISGAFHQAHHALDDVFDLVVADRDGLGPHRLALAGAQRFPIAFSHGQPGVQIGLGRVPRVPFDEIVQPPARLGKGLPLPFEQRQVRLAVEAAVLAQQDRLLGQALPVCQPESIHRLSELNSMSEPEVQEPVSCLNRQPSCRRA